MRILRGQPEESGPSSEDAAQVLQALEFQTALLTLNAAVEAAQMTGPPHEQAQSPPGSPLAGGERDGSIAAFEAPSYPAGSAVPVLPADGSAWRTSCSGGTTPPDREVEARWRGSLARLCQSLDCLDTAPPPVENALPQPAPDPQQAPVLRRRRPPLAGSQPPSAAD